MKFIPLLVSLLCIPRRATGKAGTRGAKSTSVRRTPRALMGKAGGKHHRGNNNNPCSLCNGSGKPDAITLRYSVPAADSPYHAGSSDDVCGASSAYTASNTVSIGGATMNITVGDEITITNPATWTSFDFETGPNCEIHTSCSVDLVANDQIGPWIVVPPDDCVASVSDDCLICDNTEGNKIKPPSLTFQYVAAGKNSAYQPEDKATCREGLYPEATLIEAYTKNGVQIYSGTHSTGDKFTITPADTNTEFSAETTFTFSGMDGSCFIHTSCSIPLVQNDQIGPLKVLAGNDCAAVECLVANKEFYECGDDISIAYDYAATTEPKRGDDWIGIYPCDVTEYKHAEAWLWACSDVTVTTNGRQKVTLCTNETAVETAAITFTDPMPAYNDLGPHAFPISAFHKFGPGTEVNNCFKAVLLREDGPSVPPYVEVCTSAPFTIANGTSAECQIRDSSFSFPF